MVDDDDGVDELQEEIADADVDVDVQIQLRCDSDSCKKQTTFSEVISFVMIWTPEYRRPLRYMLASDVRICLEATCKSFYRLVTQIQDTSKSSRGRQAWARALIVFASGRGFSLRREGDAPPAPTAPPAPGIN